ncbi:hypothetical protein FRC03_005889 [Tulasnella sp. 419]|nr:hypothetical protein FRC03_005889 [Tulasnella sp. 419]
MIGVVLVSLPLFIGVKNAEDVHAPSKEPSPTNSDGHPIPILERIHPVDPLLAIALLLGIPALWIGTVTPRLKTTNVRWKWALWVGIVSLASFAGPKFSNKIRDLAMICCVGWGYVVPALLHITLHTLRPPLSIILPKDSASTDDLLVRKERSLQKRRFGRRIWWDITVWALLAPIGLIGWTWWAGRVISVW